MSELTKICNEIDRINEQESCNDLTQAGYPRFVIFGAENTKPTVAGDFPTVAEMQAYLDTGNAFKLPLAGGTIPEPTLTTIDGAETESEIEKVVREDNHLESIYKRIYNDALRSFAQNNLNNDVAQMWYIDHNYQLHGGEEGFLTPFYIPNYQSAGRGTESNIMIRQSWEKKRNEYKPFSTPDTGYATLKNYISEGTYTETPVTTYVAGQVQGYNGITGWDKDSHPTIYLNIVSGVINIYLSDGARTAGTGEVAQIDTTASFIVQESGSSGWGGAISFVSSLLADGSEWNVTFTA